jgi:molybdopterin-binding protein
VIEDEDKRAKRSAEELGLAEGKEVSVVIKATNVMIGLE